LQFPVKPARIGDMNAPQEEYGQHKDLSSLQFALGSALWTSECLPGPGDDHSKYAFRSSHEQLQ
jgi:hypothetical protein